MPLSKPPQQEPQPTKQPPVELELPLHPHQQHLQPELPLLSERILMLPAKSPPKEKRVAATLLTEITEMKKKI